MLLRHSQCLTSQIVRQLDHHPRHRRRCCHESCFLLLKGCAMSPPERTLPSLNLKTLSGLQASFNDLCCSASQGVIELRLRLSKRGSTDACVAALHHPERSSGRHDLVSRLRIETFRDRHHVAVGMTVPLVLCFSHKLGVTTQSHSQTVKYTGYGRRDRWSSRLGRCSTGRSPAQPLGGSDF